jgi:chromosome partitioning protein
MLVVVAFLSQKGGVGKSTLARALAAVAALTKIKVKIADLDPRQHTVASWQERRQESRTTPTLQVARFAMAAEAINAASSSDQLLILDAPAGTSNATLEIARVADLIVQPSGSGIDDLDPAILLFHELVRAGIGRERLMMALCRVGTKDEEHRARAYVEKAGYRVLSGSIPERAAYREAHNRGQAVTEVKLQALNERTDALMGELLSSITDRVKLRVLAAKTTAQKGGSRR